MTADQILNVDFLKRIATAIDRYYDTSSGEFREGYGQFHTAMGHACVIKAALESVGKPTRVVGTAEMPSDSQHPEAGSGYDWALVDNRWIIDMFLWAYYAKDPVLYDLQDPAQAALAIETFGPQSTWTNVSVGGMEMDVAKDIWNEVVVPYDAVDDLLGGLPER